jgi:molecular chaperone DnaK
VGYVLGLDLGTTFSGAAVARDGRAEMVALAHSTSTVPSVLFLREDGTFLVGDAAIRRGLQDPGRMAREFKRRFGDTTPLLLGGSPWSADALSVQLLRHLLDAVVAQQGGPPDAVTVTHPANWGRYKVDLLRQAVRTAGLGDAGLLTEPEAAAIHYASTERMHPGEIVAIYDLGGGTFDAAALRRTDAGFELLGTAEGIERLGGIDFDEAVLGHVVSFAGPALAELDPAEPADLAALARLRAECVAAKEGLSEDTEVSIPVVLPSLQTQIRLTRAEFEDMVRPTLAETTAVLSRTLRSGGVSPDEVKAVLLVGGSSRIPLVGQMVAAEMGRPVAVDVHPKHAVALGAALHAASNSQVVPAPVVPELPRTVPAPKAPEAPAPAVPKAAASPSAGSGGRGRLVAGAVAVVLAVVVAAVLISSRGGGTPEVKIDPEVPTFEVQDSVVSMASGAGALWLAGPYGVGRFDLATNTVTQSLRIGTDGNTRRVAFGAGVVWVTDAEAKTLIRIDPATNTVAGTATLAGGPRDVLFAGDAIWVTLPDNGVVVHVDPITQAMTAIPVRGQPQYLAFGSGTLWVSDPANRTVARVDPVRLVVTGDATAGQCPDFVVADNTSVWVQDECEVTTVYRVDPSTAKVAGSATVGKDAKGLAVAGGTLFVANATDNTVSVVDAASMSVRRTLRVGSSPIAFAAAGGAMWVANQGDSTISRIDS